VQAPRMQAETTQVVHTLVSTTVSTDTDTQTSTTDVCTDSQGLRAHLPLPVDTDAGADALAVITEAGEPANTTHLHTGTDAHTHCESHTNAAVRTTLHVPAPALTAAGMAKQGDENMGRGEGEREDAGMVTGMSDEEERARQYRLMRSVAQFLKEVAGGAGCEAGASSGVGAGTGGGVGCTGVHMRQSPPRLLLLRSSAEEEAVSIASMVSHTHTHTQTHTWPHRHTHTRP
jgi:hypothetical protein